MYTIEKDFSTKPYYSETIVERGSNWKINYSSILTKLIQECGRFCERFASDLFIDWKSIEDRRQNHTLESGTHLFGIRENGVDHNDFILCEYERNGMMARCKYRKIYRLDIKVKDGDITMEFYEIEKPYSERKVDE